MDTTQVWLTVDTTQVWLTVDTTKSDWQWILHKSDWQWILQSLTDSGYYTGLTDRKSCLVNNPGQYNPQLIHTQQWTVLNSNDSAYDESYRFRRPQRMNKITERIGLDGHYLPQLSPSHKEPQRTTLVGQHHVIHTTPGYLTILYNPSNETSTKSFSGLLLRVTFQPSPHSCWTQM